MREFIDNDFAPFVESRFASKPKTLEYYRSGLKNLREFGPLAGSPLDAITGDKIAAFIGKRRQAQLAVASINRQLEVLRWLVKLGGMGQGEKVLPKFEMLSGENHRERVLGLRGGARYLAAASAQSYLLRDVATVLNDCALRPEECFRLRRDELRDVRSISAFARSKLRWSERGVGIVKAKRPGALRFGRGSAPIVGVEPIKTMVALTGIERVKSRSR